MGDLVVGWAESLALLGMLLRSQGSEVTRRLELYISLYTLDRKRASQQDVRLLVIGDDSNCTGIFVFPKR